MTLTWFLFALGPAVFYSLSNLVDQYITRVWTTGSPLAFLSISSFSSLPVLLVLSFAVIPNHNVFASDFWWVFMAVVCFVLGMFPYLRAIETDDVRNATPFYQTIPFFLAVLGYVFLHETLTFWQMIGGIVVIFSTTFSLIDFKKIHIQWSTVGLMLSAAFVFAVHDICLRMVAPHTPWVLIIFWYIFCWTLVAPLIFLFHRATRGHVIDMVQKTRGRILALCGLQQCNDFVAILCLSVAYSYAVPISITALVAGLKPFIILGFSLLAARVMPKIFDPYEGLRAVGIKMIWLAFSLWGLWMVLA